jgi:flagellar biosynthesis chaperone FliJ
MNKTVAGYYEDELAHWIRQIQFYNNEIAGLGTKLAQVIQRNSIPHIADKVEAQQTTLDKVLAQFKMLQVLIDRQHNRLKKDQALIDNRQIDENTNETQNQLRQQMEQAEKFYLEVKYGCYHFLSESLGRQK